MTSEPRRQHKTITAAILWGIIILMVLLAIFVHPIVGIWAIVAGLLLMLITLPSPDLLKEPDGKAMSLAGVFLVVGAILVWYSYWNFEQLLPASPATIPPYELTGLGATLFGAAAAILIGAVMVTSKIEYTPARILVVGGLFMIWLTTLLAYLRYGTRPAFISVNEELADMLVTLLFVLGGALCAFGIILHSWSWHVSKKGPSAGTVQRNAD
jgi:hypothetical protein